MSDASESSTDPAVLKIREEAAEKRCNIRALKVRIVNYLVNPTSKWHKKRLIVLLKRLRICESSRGAGSRFLKDLGEWKLSVWAKLLYFFGTRMRDPEIQGIYLDLLRMSPFLNARLVTTGFACSASVNLTTGRLNIGAILSVPPGKVLWVFGMDVDFEITRDGLGQVTIVRVCSASGQRS
jgi:hypothetical protein